MKHLLFCGLCVVVYVGSIHRGIAQPAVIYVRADSLVTTTASGSVNSWQSVSGRVTFLPGLTGEAPLLVHDAMNGRPAVRFSNNGYLIGPSIFPTMSDYTLYVVARWDGKAASNNLFSGISRALYLANTPYPRVLHGGNFSLQGISSIVMTGPSVIRVEYSAEPSMVRISINNKLADATEIPVNTDSVCYIGAYAGANFFWGDIAEVVLYNRLLTEQERSKLESDIHSRYSIPHAPNPPAPVVLWEWEPRPYELIPVGENLRVKGRIIDSTIHKIVFTLDSTGIPIESWTFALDTSAEFDFERTLAAGLHDYHLVGMAVGSDSLQRIIDADHIVCGIPMAIEGQSNCIYSDLTQVPSAFVRTFGMNFSQRRADTLFSVSQSASNGRGGHVGSWGLRLQNNIAGNMNLPTCVINGAVGGTRIEQHFPNEENRYNMNTIYGSWLYRLEKSRMRNHIRWLFWYQGESNSGSDDYSALFSKLYDEWKKDLPNLEHIVVVQIHTGCGGTEHARLRDDQRKLQQRYSDIIVHSACGLPGHDNCHYRNDGYWELGDQLFRLFRDIENGITSPASRAPDVRRAVIDPETNTVTITTDYAVMLVPSVPGADSLPSAFFFNGNEAVHPDTVWLTGNNIHLDPPDSIRVSTVSYIPDRFNDKNEYYQGPWIYDETGVGVLTFHNIPVIPSGVDEDAERSPMEFVQVRRGGRLSPLPTGQAWLISATGERIGIGMCQQEYTIPPTIAAGLYCLQIQTGSTMTTRYFLVTD